VAAPPPTGTPRSPATIPTTTKGTTVAGAATTTNPTRTSSPQAEVQFDVDEAGSYGPDELGFQGQWGEEAGPASEVEVSFDDGDVCLNGETGQVIDDDYGTYWGARATFGLCQKHDGAEAVNECLPPSVRRDFVGVAFSLEGAALPRLVTIQFNETDRESPTSLWLQTEGETLALFEYTTNPFDSSAPALNPNDLESITVRAVGATDVTQAFDFCVRDVRALFGEAWAEALIPDWLDEEGPGKQVDFVGANLVGAEFGEQNR